MSTSAHGAVPGSNGSRRRVGARHPASGCLAPRRRPFGQRRRRDKPKTTVVLGDDRDACPSPPARRCPARRSAASPASRSATTSPACPFRVSRAGKVKSWTLTLAQPTNSQRSFFNGFFGTPPRLASRSCAGSPGTNPPRYNLRSQGAVHVLSPYLGQTVSFGANLRVEKGDIIGITVPTWAPAFSQGLTAKNVWRASREPGTAPTPPTSARASRS